MGIVSYESLTKTDSEKSKVTVINPWLSGGLVVAVVGYAVLSGVLILKLGSFEDTKHQALEAEAALGKARTELSSLQVEVDSLKKQKEALAPTIIDWEKRLGEKAQAEALLATLESKRRQTEADISQAANRLNDANKNLVNAERQKAALNSEIDNLEAEHLSLTKVKTEAEATLRRTMEAEHRWNEAQSALTNVETRRKQLEAEVAQEEQKLVKLQQQLSSTEARRSEIEEGQRRTASEREQLANRLEQIRKDVADWELRRDTAKADFQKADSDLFATRKLFQEASAKQDDLVRESSRLETIIERLKKEKETLEKELGRLESQRPKSPAGEQ